MTPLTDLKEKILTALTAHGTAVVPAELLATQVYGSAGSKERAKLRNEISRMRPLLAERGLAIEGRKELKQNAYRLTVAM